MRTELLCEAWDGTTKTHQQFQTTASDGVLMQITEELADTDQYCFFEAGKPRRSVMQPNFFGPVYQTLKLIPNRRACLRCHA